MICPRCQKNNQCDCSNCNPDGDKPNVAIWIDEVKGILRCSYCGYNFNENESLDVEWKLMHKYFKDNITLPMVIEWHESTNKKDIENGILGDYAYQTIFLYYFKKRPDEVKDWISLKRDIQLDNIL